MFSEAQLVHDDVKKFYEVWSKHFYNSEGAIVLHVKLEERCRQSGVPEHVSAGSRGGTMLSAIDFSKRCIAIRPSRFRVSSNFHIFDIIFKTLESSRMRVRSLFCSAFSQ